jgi:beta-glucosidase
MSQVKNARFRNPALDPHERVEDLVSFMTLEEKVAQMMCIWNDKKDTLIDEKGNFDLQKAKRSFSHGHGIGQIGRPSDAGKDEQAGHDQGFDVKQTVELTNAIQKFFIENSRLGIPVIFHEECLHGLAAKEAISFPQPIALAGTFNPDLIEQLYALAAKETRERGAHQALTPVVDVARDPRWGRVEETFGEDPFLVSEMGKAAVQGFQGDASFSGNDKVIATLKHFAAHGQPESGMNCGPVNISERVLRETFLMPFKEAVQEAGVISIMPSYNEIDGIPSHSNSWLLKEVLRNEWGFDGYLVSDYYAITELHYREATHGHHVALSKKNAAELAVMAGVNMELPEPDCFKYLSKLVKEGKVKEEVIDELVKPLLYWKFKMGLFENPFTEYIEVNDNKARKELALKAALESITLLKNEDGILPLSREKLKKVAVIGPNANISLLGGYSGLPEQSVTVLDGIKAALTNDIEVVYHEGCKITVGGRWEEDEVILPSEKDELESIKEAADIAKSADVIILAIGGNDQTSREAWSTTHMGDRTSLDLFGYQNDLFDELAKTGKPIISALYNGRPLSISNVVERSDAILECWYGGQEAGHALASVIFGDYNPTGKLPISIPRSVGQLPIYYNYKPSARRGYLDEDNSPLFPFGFGLNYTNFTISSIKIKDQTIRKSDSTEVTCTVTNTGNHEGAEVVQMYVRDLVSSVTRPMKELKGFKKIWLNPGESKTITIPITSKSLAFYDINMEYVVEPGEFEIMVGNSSKEIDLQKLLLKVTD